AIDKGRPGCTTVGGGEDTNVGANIQCVRQDRVNHDVVSRNVGQIAVDGPARAAVRGLVNVTAARPGQGDVHGNGTARIHSDSGNVAVRHSGGSVDPDGPRARAGVGCDVHVAIVAAHIHRVAVAGSNGDSGERPATCQVA